MSMTFVCLLYYYKCANTPKVVPITIPRSGSRCGGSFGRTIGGPNGSPDRSEKSSSAQRRYIVNNLKKKSEVANKLLMLDEMIQHLIRVAVLDVMNKEPNRHEETPMGKYVENLRSKYELTILKENESLRPRTDMTSFNINKGEMMVFCVRKPDTPYSLIDDNTLKYVAIHEISHIACPEIGHTPLFREIFAYLVKLAIQHGLYTYVDYSTKPQEYCGLEIHQTVAND